MLDVSARHRVHRTIWRFLGYRSTNKMPRRERNAWIAFTNGLFGITAKYEMIKREQEGK